MAVLAKTRMDLILRVLEILNIISENRPAFPNEITSVDKIIDGFLQDLAERQIAYVGDDEEIDVAQFEPLAKLLANQAGPPFGVPEDAGKKEYYEQQLFDQRYGRPSYEPLAVDYY